MNKLKFLAIFFASTLAGAQTVSVGTMSSVQNGTTTTITVPVSVAVPPTTSAPTATPKFSLDVESGNGSGTNVFQKVGNAFTTISLANTVTDTASAWSSTSNAYVIPTTGMYLIVASVRLADGAPTGVNYGMGVGSVNADSPSFTWSTTTGLRNGFNSSRIAYLTAGTPVNLFVYVDSSNPIGLAGASLNIQQLP